MEMATLILAAAILWAIAVLPLGVAVGRVLADGPRPARSPARAAGSRCMAAGRSTYR